MRALLVVAMVVGGAGQALAGPARPIESAKPVAPKLSCQHAGAQLSQLLGSSASEPVLARRCAKDHWSRAAYACVATAATHEGAHGCLESLSKRQRTTLAGDADRMRDATLGRFLLRRSVVRQAPRTGWRSPSRANGSQQFGSRASLPPPVITLAVLGEVPDFARARLLHAQGVTAYQAGRFELAIEKFEAAIDVDPTPELVYQAAQAYRLTGNRAEAVEHYAKYLDLAPRGAAANACRAQLERLRDAVP